MSNAFIQDFNEGDDDEQEGASIPVVVKNYITHAGYAVLHAELISLMDDERPKIVELVHWAASNGDRSENGDYLYGKKRLREIDRRIRFLTQRLEIAQRVDASVHYGCDQVFFGATVTYQLPTGLEKTITILGIDEADSTKGQVSWVSPIAKAFIKSVVGDVVRISTPAGWQEVEIVAVGYPTPVVSAV